MGAAHSQALGLALQGFDEAIKDVLLHIDAFRTQANLASIQENCLADPADCLLKIAVCKHDGSILPAEFEGNRLHRRSHRLHDRRARLRIRR